MPALRQVRIDDGMLVMDDIDLGHLRAWAYAHITAHPEPDFTVTNHGVVYLQRWYMIPRNDVRNVYLHCFLGDDDARAPHDHRGDNLSYLLDGEYDEHLYSVAGAPLGVERRRAGDCVQRSARQLHRAALVDARPALSLFFIGPTVRD